MPISLTKRLKSCFIIGPIGNRGSVERTHADKLLKLIIKPTFAKHFKTTTVQRADDISKPGMIDSQVISLLMDADLVVADLTTRNPNVFYELGIRHFVQKPVIHLYLHGEPIPFDIQPYRAIEFSYSDKFEVRDAKIALRKAITEVIQHNFHIENPVTRSRAMVSRQKENLERRKALLELAETAQVPIAILRGNFEAFASRSENITFKPEALKRYVDDLARARDYADALYEAIEDIEL